MWIITGTLGTTRAQQQWVVLPHAVQLFVSNSKYSESAIRAGLTDTTTSSQHRRATPSELAWLKQQGAVTGRSTLITLVSLSKCLEVGRHFGVPTNILDQLRQQPQAVSLPTTAMAAAPAPPQPTPTAALAGNTMPRQYSNTAATIQHVCPATLPPPTWSQEQLQARQYGLTTQESARGEVLNRAMAELQQLQAWSCTPLRIDRPREVSMLAATSWAGNQGEILRFLGFIHKHKGVQHPTLHHYLNGFLLADFISFLQARDIQPQQLADAVHQAERVVAYLAYTNKLNPAELQLFPTYRLWLANMAWQLASNLQPPPKPSLQERLQQGSWMKAEELMMCMQQVMDGATVVEDRVASDMSAAKLNMHAAFCCSFFGWVPPLRPSTIISLQHPNYSGPCLHPSCQHPTRCKGNRVVVEGDTSDSCCSSSSSSGGNTYVSIIAPHHKASKWWEQTRPIECELPSELAGLYLTHCYEGWDKLVGNSANPQGTCSYFFVQVQKGQQLLPQQASQIFSSVVLPHTHRFGPQAARGIFVTAARSQQLGDVSEAAAAAAMGHSLKMWEQVYDRAKVHRLAARNVAALAKWRHGVLAAAASRVGPAAPAAAPGGVGHAATAAAGGVAAEDDSDSECIDLTMDTDSE
jgi:hypothetical protein